MEDNEKQEKLARLKATRKSHRGVTTRYINEVDDLLKHEPLDQKQQESVENLRKRLDLKLRTLETIDQEILDLCDLGTIDKEIEESETLSFRVTEITSKIQRALATSQRRNEREVRESTPSSQSTISTTSEKQSRTKLPRLDLQKFNGDILKFSAFWDRFETAIDKNEGIPTIEKLNYLIHYLEGAAARIVDGLQITEKNYDAAKKILKKRYGKCQMIITAHMEELLKLRPCTGEKPNQLRYLFDKISIHLRGLESLGVASENNGATLIPVLMGKLPADIRVQVARLTSNDAWSLKEILELLENEVEAREVGESIKVNDERVQFSSNPRNPPIRNTASTLYTDMEKRKPNITCVYCNGEHYSASCERIKDISQRVSILKQKGRCFVCLRYGHRKNQCRLNKLCKHCRGKHHQSICEHESRPKQDQQGNEMENTTSASTLTRSKGKSVVLLQTAKTMAFKDGEAKGISVRILLDNGSQQSYITESLKTRLKLEPVKQKTLHLNTFGGEKVSKNGCSWVKFYLLCKEGKRIEIQALSFPKICTPLPAQIDLSDYPHLEDLELADPLDSESQVEPVDILIGSDMYWEIVNGDVIRENTGPIAVSSKFGWVISGPVKGSHVNVASVANLVINAPELSQSNHDPIISELRRFWETDSTGIIDDPKSEQDTPFLKKFSFDGERYKVGLPWKEVEIEPLPVDYNLSLNRLNSLYSRLKEHPDILKEYDNIIQEQEKMGIIEEVPKTEQTNEFYKNNDCHFIPHHGVCRKDRETTKLRIFFDGSAKTSERELSMNDYLNNGPNFIPPLFDILTRFRTKPVALVADVEKAFLQISIEERDRNTLRFVWYQPPSEGQGTPVLKRFCYQ